MFVRNIYRTASVLSCLCILYSSASQSEELAKQAVHLKEEGFCSAKGKHSRTKARLKREKKLKPLSLEDFAGSFVVLHESKGGVGGGTGLARAGVSVRTFDKKGNSTFGDTYFLDYTGTPGEVIPAHFTTENTDMKIRITEPVKGLGVLQTFLTNKTIETDFVVQRSAVDGAVTAFYTISSISNRNDRQVEGVEIVTFIRQVQ